MNIAQIVFRTIVTTIDVILAAVLIKSAESSDGVKRTFTAIVLLNLAGIWV